MTMLNSLSSVICVLLALILNFMLHGIFLCCRVDMKKQKTEDRIKKKKSCININTIRRIQLREC